MGNACISGLDKKSVHSVEVKKQVDQEPKTAYQSHDESIFTEFEKSVDKLDSSRTVSSETKTGIVSSSTNSSPRNASKTVSVSFEQPGKKITFKWTEEYMLGILFIDRQHKRLVELIVDLNTVSHETFSDDESKTSQSEKVKQVLDELLLYTQIHFHEEEAVMMWYHYPYTKAHRKVHSDFVGRVSKARESFQHRESAKEDAKIAQELSIFLQEWLVSHILQIDKRLVEFVSEKDPALEHGDDYFEH